MNFMADSLARRDTLELPGDRIFMWPGHRHFDADRHSRAAAGDAGLHRNSSFNNNSSDTNNLSSNIINQQKSNPTLS